MADYFFKIEAMRVYMWIFRYIIINAWSPSIQRSMLQIHHSGNFAAWCWVREIFNPYGDEQIDQNLGSYFHIPKCSSLIQLINHSCGLDKGISIRTSCL